MSSTILNWKTRRKKRYSDEDTNCRGGFSARQNTVLASWMIQFPFVPFVDDNGNTKMVFWPTLGGKGKGTGRSESKYWDTSVTWNFLKTTVWTCRTYTSNGSSSPWSDYCWTCTTSAVSLHPETSGETASFPFIKRFYIYTNPNSTNKSYSPIPSTEVRLEFLFYFNELGKFTHPVDIL